MMMREHNPYELPPVEAELVSQAMPAVEKSLRKKNRRLTFGCVASTGVSVFLSLVIVQLWVFVDAELSKFIYTLWLPPGLPEVPGEYRPLESLS